MCGISGYIGESKDLRISHRLITALFRECEIRGDDAAGFWGSESGNGHIVYHKEPVKSSEFVKKQIWKDLAHLNLNMLLVHARGASVGVGTPKDNKNNHPFSNTSRSIGLIHNGRIPDTEYDVLVKKYEVHSKCDSEILLRIFEAGETYSEDEINKIGPEEVDPKIANRLLGLRDIWSYIDKGHMAVAIGERVNDDERNLFLFRNKWRSLWVIDCRKDLGQVFFCSTPEIWNIAFRSAGVGKFLKNKIKMIELPTEELWVFQTNASNPVVQKVKKYDICSSGRTIWKHEGQMIPIAKNVPATNVITYLNDKEEITYKPQFEVTTYEPQFIEEEKTKNSCNALPANWIYEQAGPIQSREDCDSDDRVWPVDIHNKISDNASPAEIRAYWEAKWGVKAESHCEIKRPEEDDEYDTILENSFDSPIGLKAFSDVCKNIRIHLNNLEAAIERQMLEEVTTPDEISDLMQSMEQIELDLDGTCRLWINNSGKSNDYGIDEPDYYNVS